MTTTAALDRADVLRASDEWRWLPPGAAALEIEGVPVIDYPTWAMMGFYATPLEVRQPAVAVDAVQAQARVRGRASVDWWIAPSTRPASLEELLVARGAALKEKVEILAADVASGTPELSGEMLDTHVVGDAKRLDDAEQVAAEVWGGEPSSGDRRAAQLASVGDPLDNNGGFRVVAYLDGRPVSTAGCQVVDGVARLYGGGTVADARGRGAYHATIAKRLEIARQADARMALVHARVDTSRPILLKLGFQSYGEARLYELTTENGT